MTDSPIEWTDKTWNPVRGCRRVSPGCERCYAERTAARFSGAGQPYEGLAERRLKVVSDDEQRLEPRWTGEVRIVESKLDEPLRWRKPQKVFVNSMSDLFHEDVPADFIVDVFAVMALAPRHTFQVLTKRPERMRRFLSHADCGAQVRGRAWRMLGEARRRLTTYEHENVCARPWPLPNVWLGVSVEDQRRADERITLLLETPAAVRFLSVEPLLERIDIFDWLAPMVSSSPDQHVPDEMEPLIHWVIVGGESGPGARRCDVRNVRRVVEQCRAAGVPVFVKQLGAFVVDRNDRFSFDEEPAPGHWPGEPEPQSVDHNINGYREDHQGADCRIHLRDRKGGDPAEWPADLRVREFPEVARV